MRYTGMLGFGVVLALSSAREAITATAQETAVFKDRTSELGLKPGNGAACWVDIDNDGWVDLCAPGGVWRNREGKASTRTNR